MGMSGHRTRSVFNRYFIVDRAELDAAVKKLEAGRNESLSRLEAQSAKRSLALVDFQLELFSQEAAKRKPPEAVKYAAAALAGNI